jgi:tetratricopeptide (TPR) repeat protein
MRNIIILVSLIMLTFICSCSGRNETALDWSKKAEALMDKDPVTAIQYLNKAIKLQPDYASAYNNRGVAYAKLSQYERAIEDFNENLRLQPDSAATYVNRGMAHILMGNKNAGCLDVQKACNMGACKGLDWAKGNGFCR